MNAKIESASRAGLDHPPRFTKRSMRRIVYASAAGAIAAIASLTWHAADAPTPKMISAADAREHAAASADAYFPAQFPAPEGPLQPQPEAF